MDKKFSDSFHANYGEPGDAEDCVWNYLGYKLDKGNFVTAMVHFYRAEVTRVNLWRSRLDTTTNWSVVTTAAALTFGFGSAENPHFVILLVLVLLLIFLNIEARRYAYYSLWYHRAQLLETNFFAAMLSRPFKPAPDWGDELADILRHPVFPISHWEAMGNRFRRNYALIIAVLILSWALKLIVHPTTVTGLKEFIARAAIGEFLPGTFVIAAVLLTYLLLVLITLEGYRRFRKRGVPRRAEWQHKGPHHFRYESTPHLAVIVTKQRDRIAARLMTELGRGVTAMEGVGMYTGENRSVLLCAITDVQMPHLRSIVREVDEEGFVVITQARDVRGGHFAPYEPPS